MSGLPPPGTSQVATTPWLRGSSTPMEARPARPPVRREFHVVHALAPQRDRLHQRHRLRIPEIEPPAPLGHHDGEPAVRGEIQVVRIRDRYARALATRRRIDGGERVPAVVRDPE